MPTLEQSIKATNNYLKMYNGQPTEFDMSINDISRDIIVAMHKEKGECWLGKINLYDEDEKPFKLLKFEPGTGQEPLYNFCYGFVLPAHDQQLEKMINDKENVKGFDSLDLMTRIKAITNRIISLKGIFLIWA